MGSRRRPHASGIAHASPRTPAARGRHPGWTTILALCLLTFVLAACGGAGGDGGDGSEAVANGGTPPTEASTVPAVGQADSGDVVRRVTTVQAVAEDLTATKTASASIRASRESQVAAGTSGRVDAVLLRAGASVERGTVVVQLDDTSLRSQVENASLAVESAQVNLVQAQRRSEESTDQLQAQLQTARTNVELARDRYREGLELFQAGGISQVELRSLEAQRDQAEGSFLQARDALAQAERAGGENLRLLELQVAQAQTQLRQARDALAEARIQAPFAGEIADVYVEEGEFVGAGSPAFRLIAQDERQATFSVSSEDAAMLQAQGLVYVRYGGLDYAAQITRLTRSAQQPRLVELSADLYPSDQPIPTGSVAQVRYTVPLASGVTVPSAALAADGGSTYVFTIHDGVAERVPVRIVAESGARAVIEGLPAGTDVISPRPLDVRDGTTVRAVDE